MNSSTLVLPTWRRWVGVGMLGATLLSVGVPTVMGRHWEESRFDVAFGRGTTQAEGGDAVVMRAASLLRARSDERAYVTGHTDSGGDAAADQALSESRAAMVAAGLRANGIDPSRIVAVGVGSSAPPPRLDGEGEAAWHARWARVDVKVAR